MGLRIILHPRPNRAIVRASSIWLSTGKIATWMRRSIPDSCLLAFRPYRTDIVQWEVGGGRATRQPGQIRKEAALTSAVRVARQPPTSSLSPRGRMRPPGGWQDQRNHETYRTRPGFRRGVRRNQLLRAGAQIPAGALQRPDRPGRHGAYYVQPFWRQAHPAGVDPHRRTRRGQDYDRPHPSPSAQLRTAGRLDHTADDRHAEDGYALPGDHRKPPS